MVRLPRFSMISSSITSTETNGGKLQAQIVPFLEVDMLGVEGGMLEESIYLVVCLIYTFDEHLSRQSLMRFIFFPRRIFFTKTRHILSL